MVRIALAVFLCASFIRADDPELLAKDFVRLSKTVGALGGTADLDGFRESQRRAAPLYREFLLTHPESVYDTTVRWSLHGAYLTLEWREQVNETLDEIQDSLLQELLKVAFAQRIAGNQKGASQLIEGILEKCEDGGIRARAAQYLYLVNETSKALEILNEVIEGVKYPEEIRARALLIKAELHRYPTQDVAPLQELVRRFPKTAAGLEGQRKLVAATLKPGDDALPFTVATVSGETLQSAQCRGKAVLLYFFATWSYPSWRDLKDLKGAVEKLPPGSMVVIGASCDTYIDRPKQFFAERGIAWPLVAEGNKWRNSLARLYDVDSLPFFVLVDRKGKILFKGTEHVAGLVASFPAAVAE
jgi:peroxiredoxin